MEITGKIQCVCPSRQGMKQDGTTWICQPFVMEYQSGNYVKHCMFEVWGADKLQKFNINVGCEYVVDVEIDCRQAKDGRWFNSVTAWRVTPKDVAAQSQQAQQAQPQAPQPTSQYDAPFVQQGENEGLPF